MKSRRKQSVYNSTSATQTESKPPEKRIPPASVSASAISKLTEATIVLALLTFAGYWYAFCFELGFFSYFGIPYYFVSVTPTIILSISILWILLGTTLGIVLLAIAVWIILGPIERDMNARHPKIMKIVLVSIAISGIVFLIYSLITEQKSREILTVKNVSASVVFGLVCILLMWIYENYNKTIPWGFVRISLGITIYFVILALGFRFLPDIGSKEAQKKDVFPVYRLPASTNDVAVIRNYGDYLLAVPFTRITRKDDKDETPAPFKKQLVIVKMPDVTTPLTLSFEQIGPLKPEAIKPVEGKPAP